MTTHTLNIKQFVPPDGNPFNPDRIQISGGSRRTEDDAERFMRYGEIAMPPPPITMNGQIVDTRTMLMCSRCCSWKKDKEFARDRTRTIRRGRRYYCSACLKKMR